MEDRIKTLASKARKATQGGGGSCGDFDDHVSYHPKPVDVRTRKRWMSTLWCKAGRIKLLPTLSFRQFWGIFLAVCNMIVGPKPCSVEIVHTLFAVLDPMKQTDFVTATIVLSPTNPKPKEDAKV